jgi:hypothetical protein
MLRMTTNFDPVLGSKVDALGTIEAQVESRVVAVWVGQNEFAGKLDELVERDAFVGELARRGEE